MMRRLKSFRDGAVYHVMTRTAQKKFWLSDPEMKEFLLELILFYGQVYFVEILAFAILDNHYHILLRVRRPPLDEKEIKRRYELACTNLVNKREWNDNMANHLHKRFIDLSWFMWEINRRMSVQHNRIRKTAGHLWGARFKSINVEEERIPQVMAYIDLNPVRAGMITDPGDYTFTSVGRIQAQLGKGEHSDVPAVGFLAEVPQEHRAQIYLAWIKTLAENERPKANQEPEARHWAAVDMDEMRKVLASRAPANWRSQTYGSKEFQEQCYTEAGWLRSHPGSKETAPKGRSIPSEVA